MILIKRVYETARPADGCRILIDRLWPRGLSKTKARVDLWLKEIAPSDSLRKWFSHDPKKWPEFQRRYRKELKFKKDLIHLIHDKAKKETVTLLFGAKDEIHNQAVVLKRLMK